MSNEKFKVKFGLAVGDTVATVDGTTGNIVTNGSVKLNGSSSGSTTLTVPATGSDLTYVLPGSQGSADTVLTNDGSGNLSWALPGGGGSTFGNITVAVVDDNTISTTTGDLKLDSATGNVIVNTNLATNSITNNGGSLFFGTTDNNNIEMYTNGFTGPDNLGLTLYPGYGVSLWTQNYAYELKLDTSGNTTLPVDLQINGNNIKASDGNTNITLTSNTLTTFAGDIQINGNDIKSSSGTTAITLNGADVTLPTGNLNSNGVRLETDGTRSYPDLVPLIIKDDTGGGVTIQAWAMNSSYTSPTAITPNQTILNLRNIPYVGTWAGNTPDFGTLTGYGYGGDLFWKNFTDTATDPIPPLWEYGYATTRGSWNLSSIQTPDSDSPTSTIQDLTNWEFIGQRLKATTFDLGSYYTQVDSTPKITAVTAGGTEVDFKFKTDGSFTAPGSIIGAGGQFGNITIGIDDDNTINTTTGELLLTSDNGDIRMRVANEVKIANNTGADMARFTDSGTQGTYYLGDPYGTNANGVNNVLFEFASDKSAYTVYGASADGSVTPTVQYFGYRRSGGNNAPTQTGDRLGQFRFGGNTNTSSGGISAPVTGGEIRYYATEDWTNTQTGTAIGIEVTKTGTIDNVNVFLSDATQTELRGDTIVFNTGAVSSPQPVIGNNIQYNRVYGQWQYNTTVTPAASNTAYVFPIGTADFNNIATVGSTSHIIPGAAGMYKLQFSVQVDNSDNGTEHTAYIWWRKNGTDVPASMGRVTVPKAGATIAGWDNIVSSANTTDYWELAYATDSHTHITFPAYSAPAFGPTTASLFMTLVPIGA